jgi:hypothetical protein
MEEEEKKQSKSKGERHAFLYEKDINKLTFHGRKTCFYKRKANKL